MSNIDKLKSAAAKAVDNFDPNMFVETRDVLALLDELEAKDKSISFLKDQLAQLANFNPDWDKLEAATDSLREHMEELTAARKRIAELEAREVKLNDINEYLAEIHDKTLNRAFRLLAEGVRAGDVASIRAAGINIAAAGKGEDS
ncbi:ead/Ea22-like family protein [Enterobacter hormaechei]|nr:ead/Ea22-like family protein [Enterobacter hormaechei]MCE1453197.1 ead/Ea22-like family protein [Enterobacter hormaechei]